VKKVGTAVSARRRPLVVGNWKMNPPTLREAIRIITGFRRKVGVSLGRVDIVICPPFPYLAALRAKFSTLPLGVQDISAEKEGAFTGQVSAAISKSCGASLAIVGHSERRAAGDGDELVARKLAATLGAGLVAVLCVGETSRDLQGSYLRVLAAQIKASLSGVPADKLNKLVVAYEPVWAIGAGKTAIGPRELLEAALYVRKCLRDTLGAKRGAAVPIIYGGSVDGDNAAALISEGEVDGFLPGRASLDPYQFSEIVAAAASARRRAK